jgi:putative ABC transporter-associated repeat protein
VNHTWSIVTRAVALLALSTTLATGALLSTAGPATAADRIVISDGHVDMGPRVVDGKWSLQLRDDTGSPPVWRTLDTVVLHGSDETKITVPAGDTYSFLGTSGTTVYVLPQVERNGLVWPGWNTQDPSVVDGVSGEVTWTIRAVDGPGDFHLFLTDSFGKPALTFDGSKGYPQTTKIRPNTHAHGNWAFSKAGIYRLQMQMSATSTTGKALTDTQTLVLAIATDAKGIPTGSNPGDGNGGGADDGDGVGKAPANDPRTSGNGTGGGSGELPKTGGGFLVPLVGGAVVLLIAGIGLRAVSRRRPADASSGS